jgi:hypothetical protein
MGRSMYQYDKRSKEKERQQKQIEKNLKRNLAKQQQPAAIKENNVPESAATPERSENEHE